MIGVTVPGLSATMVARRKAGTVDAVAEVLRSVTHQDILGWFQHAGLRATPE